MIPKPVKPEKAAPKRIRRSPIQRASARTGDEPEQDSPNSQGAAILALKARGLVRVNDPRRKAQPIKRKAQVRKTRKTGRAALARLADKLCGELVRAKGYCEADCHKSGVVLQWAHGFSRRYKATRWLPINGFCLCKGCHFKFTNHPIAWDNFLREAWGQPTYDELRMRALRNERVDLDATVASLRAEIARLEA